MPIFFQGQKEWVPKRERFCKNEGFRKCCGVGTGQKKITNNPSNSKAQEQEKDDKKIFQFRKSIIF
jgi:hypothetical protein